MNPVETIVAVSTPPGRGGIGIVRLSGPEARTIAAEMLLLRAPLEPARARLAWVMDDATDPQHADAAPIDEAVVTFFAAPNSYTGDDLVEIAAHGSPVVLDLLTRRALQLGARLADPGEFTERAFLSGRMDLTQAEAVRDLIEAKTLAQARQAASQMSGALSQRVQPVKRALLNLIALLEAGIDFAEDDVSVTAADEIARHIDALIPPLEALEKSYAGGRVLHDGLTLAIVGRPNAGKSSLFNRLAERERAIVTATPGTTRDLVTERIAIEGIPIELVDTAGVREALEEVEKIGIERTHQALADASIVLVVLDATAPLNEDEIKLLHVIEGRAAILVRNKCDLLDTSAEHSRPPSSLTRVECSALTGFGLPELRAAILRLATGGAAAEPGALTTLRQRNAVGQSLAALHKAAEANTARIPHEMLLLDLYGALEQLDELTGQTSNDDVLNLIFSSFCIGK